MQRNEDGLPRTKYQRSDKKPEIHMHYKWTTECQLQNVEMVIEELERERARLIKEGGWNWASENTSAMIAAREE